MLKQPSSIVIIAGSGRSGTTWLGSLLDSYEKSEYFYEIHHFPELDYEDPKLIKTKHPFTFFLPVRPCWVRKLEYDVVKKMAKYHIFPRLSSRSLRIHQSLYFNKDKADVFLFKGVKLLSIALEVDKLINKTNTKYKIVHIARNPYSQLASEIKQHQKYQEKMRNHFKQRVKFIMDHPKLTKYHELASKYINGGYIQHMVVLWKISNEMMMEMHHHGIYHVVYENLCNDTHQEVKNIFDFLGWEMSDQTTRHIQETTNIDISESGNWSIKKNASEAMNRWRSEISTYDYEQINEILKGSPLLKLWKEEDLII